MSGWKEECQSVLMSYIEKSYLKEAIEVPKPAAGEIMQLLNTSSEHNVFQFELCSDGSRAIVVGETSVVQSVQAKISTIRKKHQTATVMLSGREYDFFTQVVQPELKTKVTIKCVPAKHFVVISGSINEVTFMKNSMKTMVQHSIIPVVIESMLIEFFSTDGKQELTSYVQKQGLQVAFHNNTSIIPPSLEFLCDPLLCPYVRDMASKISAETQVSVMSLPKSFTAQKLSEHCKQLKSQFQVSIKTNQNQLWICGFRCPVTYARKSLESYVQKKCCVRKTFPIPTGMWHLFKGPMKSQWMKVEAQCKSSDVELTTGVKGKEGFSILLRGDKIEVQSIGQSIDQLIQSIAFEALCVSDLDSCRYFNEGGKGRIMIPDIEKAHNVHIEVVKFDENHDAATVTKHFFGNCITVEVIKGDITKEKTDAIVNTTNRDMNLNAGGVATALLKVAGLDLQKACDEATLRGEYLREGKVIDTRPGKLKCKRVFHIFFQSNDGKVFTTIIRSCIERAIQLKFTSIAFPAIGTGFQGYPAAEAAKGMITALQKCVSPHTLNVRIILFQNDVFRIFTMAFKDQVKDTAGWWKRTMKSMLPWVSSHPTPEDKEEKYVKIRRENEKIIELKIYGETEENVRNALEVLKTLHYDYEDDKIGMLSENQEKVLRDEARELQLVFDIDRALKRIRLKGSKKSISDMNGKIMEALMQVEEEARKRVEAAALMKTVQWKRVFPLEMPYDPLLNLEIERAYSQRKPTFVFKNPQSAQSFTVDFKTMEETDHAMQNRTCRVRRVAEGLPDDWEPMTDPTSRKQVALRVLDLPPTSEGYQFATKHFNKTMVQGRNYTAIVKVQRVQNPALNGQYSAKKRHMDTHNPSGVQNERWLFHGTKADSVPPINQTNFNRSLRGQNGTMYGQGCYFARDASYSNAYASADAKGLKHMYLVRVLTGEFTKGSDTMRVAPPKDHHNPTVLFDSVVNNTSNPSIFVIFYDADAYPEFLIIYK